MANKDKGWDFLSSKDVSYMSGGNHDGSGDYQADDGSYGWSDSDGSGDFHGADGSYGFKNSDGSAEYHGADGSFGYVDEDGTGTYYGADGSYGDIDLNGTSFYYGADGNTEIRDSDDEDFDFEKAENSGGSDDDGLSSLLTLFGVYLFVNHKEAKKQKKIEEQQRLMQEEAERQEREQARQEKSLYNREKRKAWRRKHVKGIVITNVILAIVLVLGIGFYEFRLLIPLKYTNSTFEGVEYTQVVQNLNDAGFSNVHTKNISDLVGEKEAEENLVTEVKLLWSDSFNVETKYPSNMPIRVIYHTTKLCKTPLASKKVKGMNYLEAIDEFRDAGFTNIIPQAKYDIVSGLLSDDGEVASVTIDDEKKFAEKDEFRSDAEIIITYHTLRKNKEK